MASQEQVESAISDAIVALASAASTAVERQGTGSALQLAEAVHHLADAAAAVRVPDRPSPPLRS